MATRLWTGQAGVWIPVRSRLLPFHQNFQTASGAHPAPWEIGTGVIFRSKVAEAWISSPSQAEFKNKWSYTSSPRGQKELLFYFFYLLLFNSAMCCNPHTMSKHFFINSTDAHDYKITGMLKQLKFPQSLRHVSVHSGTIIRELFRA